MTPGHLSLGSSNLGPNEALIGEDDARQRLSTPALMLELPAFERNLEAMATRVTGHGRQLRPHFKAHKCWAVAKRQLELGAIGLCCATVREAEVLAAQNVAGILVTSPMTAPPMIERLAAAHRLVADLAVSSDSEAGVEMLAKAFHADRPLGVVIDIDVGQGRTGVVQIEDALKLAARIGRHPGLRFRGVQAYYGQLQHVADYAARKAEAARQWVRIASFVDALSAQGQPPEIVTGSGTGTHEFDLEGGPFTEIQAGSYPFMDRHYSEVALSPDSARGFEPALLIACRVVSTATPGQAVVDAGLKAMATDAGPARVAGGTAADATFAFLGDEHGGLTLPKGSPPPALGTMITLVPPHCDPTINLHDRLHVMDGDRLLDIWPVDARGY